MFDSTGLKMLGILDLHAVVHAHAVAWGPITRRTQYFIILWVGEELPGMI